MHRLPWGSHGSAHREGDRNRPEIRPPVRVQPELSIPAPAGSRTGHPRDNRTATARQSGSEPSAPARVDIPRRTRASHQLTQTEAKLDANTDDRSQDCRSAAYPAAVHRLPL
jgi:hypothetical protein